MLVRAQSLQQSLPLILHASSSYIRLTLEACSKQRGAYSMQQLMARPKHNWLSEARFHLSPRAPATPWDPPPALYALLHFPMIFVANLLYNFILWLQAPATTDSPHPIKIVTISDTHTNIWPDVPNGDLLIHAGDLSNSGTVQEIQVQIDWLKSLPHAHKTVIAGNHDTYLDPRSRKMLLHHESHPDLDWGDIHYLQHSSVRLEFPKRGARALRIYGAPQIPINEEHPDWAFTYPRYLDAWTETVPSNIDVLITHGPPAWHLDVFGLGCKHLLRECWRVKPKLHIFGHAHTGRGNEMVHWDDCQKTYELLCERNSQASFFSSVLSIFNWLHLFRLMFYGVRSVVWNRIWGGGDDASVLINTALMYQSSGKLGNEPQVAMI